MCGQMDLVIVSALCVLKLLMTFSKQSLMNQAEDAVLYSSFLSRPLKWPFDFQGGQVCLVRWCMWESGAPGRARLF